MVQALVDIAGFKMDFDVVGETAWGSDTILLKEDDNLIKNTNWCDVGFSIVPFLTPEKNKIFTEGFRQLIYNEIKNDINVSLSEFRLEKYHQYCSDQQHLEFMQRMREGFSADKLPIELSLIEQCVSDVCSVAVVASNPHAAEECFNLRIIRPGIKGDNNPPHRDVWLNHLRDCVNIYVPIIGSNEHSALPIIPGSHLWKESDIQRTTNGARLDGVSYRVPAVVGSRYGLNMARPNPKPGEMMVFTPYAIHGGGINLNQDITRVSLEMRFWRKA